jgi:hypothetical protein
LARQLKKLDKLHNSGGATHVKNLFENFYLEMTPLEVKTCGESEFDIFEAKKHFPSGMARVLNSFRDGLCIDSGKACVLKRKVKKSHASKDKNFL